MPVKSRVTGGGLWGGDRVYRHLEVTHKRGRRSWKMQQSRSPGSSKDPSFSHVSTGDPLSVLSQY